MESEENFFDIGNLIKQKWIKIEENGGGGKFSEEEKIKFINLSIFIASFKLYMLLHLNLWRDISCREET